jgi:deoxyribodipyrimidine photo-lyase
MLGGWVGEALAKIAKNKRVTVRRGGEPKADGKCVVYWLQRAQRALDNPALELAIQCGNALGLPVVAYFSVIPNYPNANYAALLLFAAGIAGYC